MDLTYIHPVKKEEKPQKVIIVEDLKAVASSKEKKSSWKD